MIECRLAISPRPAWLNRVRLIAASVREWYPDAMVTVSCYPPQSPLPADMDCFWRSPTDAEAARWANTRAEYSATIFDRFKGELYGDWQLFMDADVIPVAPFNELFGFDGIQGVVTHVPPWSNHDWRTLFAGFGLPAPEFDHPHTGAGIMCEAGACAPRGYFNSGMLFGSRRAFEHLEKPLFEAVEYLRGALRDWYWIDQAATCLAINAAGIRTMDLPIAFNHPNRLAFDRRYGTNNLAFVHTMQTDGGFDRDADFESDETIRALCARGLTGSNEVARKRVAELWPIR